MNDNVISPQFQIHSISKNADFFLNKKRYVTMYFSLVPNNVFMIGDFNIFDA